MRRRWRACRSSTSSRGPRRSAIGSPRLARSRRAILVWSSSTTYRATAPKRAPAARWPSRGGRRLLFLNNDDVRQLLTMDMTVAALDAAYRQLATQDAVCRPRIDIQIPTRDPDKVYQWGTMEGGSSTPGYFAIRMKSDITYQTRYEGVVTHEKYASRPGLFCG